MTGPGAAGATGRGSRSAWWVGALSVVIVALLAAATIPMPFTGDQALFQLGARVLDHGGVLYRDFWDPKQPGIYLFHLLAGWAFGFDEVGAHALETVWAVGFAVVLLRTERHRYEHRWVASVVPLLTIAPVYAAATPSLLGQVEMLVSLPVYLSLWWAVAAGDADGPRPGHLAASGAVGAVVACFKLPYVLLPAIGWVVAVGLRARAGPRSRALAAGGWIALGFAVPSAIVVAYLGAHGQLGDVWHTWFVFPLGVAGRAGRPLTLLGASGRWFVERFAPLLVLGALGLVRLARRGLDRWTATVLAWCAFAAGLVLVQLWWQYLFLLLVVPLGLLAAQGVDELATRVRAPGSRGAGGVAAVVVACAVLTVFLAVDLGRSARALADHGLARTGADRSRLRAALDGAYASAPQVLAVLRDPRAPSGPVYVLGDPVYQLLSGRPWAVAVNGWLPEQLDRSGWRRLAGELRAVRPGLVYVDDLSATYVRSRGAPVAALLAQRYCGLPRLPDGRWYVVRASRLAAACSARG